MKNIAIWGSMNFGNFGDDVMNVIFGIHLKQNGFTPLLYRLDKKLANHYGLISVPDLNSLLENSAFCFIGGGSWLESRRLGEEYEKDFDDLLVKLIEKKIPLYAISIGGDSKSSIDLLTPDRKALFCSTLFKGGTVRLHEDEYIFNQLGKMVEFYPDIVLRSQEYFLKERKTNKDGKIRIGFSISANSNQYLKYLIKIFEKLPFIYSKYELIFFKTHLPNYNLKYEYKYLGNSKLILNRNYEDLDSFYTLISSLDVMISNKLHPGVAALSCNVPFLWAGGLDKTRSFLKSVKLNEYEISIDDIVKLILFKRIKRFLKDYNFKEVNRQREAAQGHLDFLTKILKEHT